MTSEAEREAPLSWIGYRMLYKQLMGQLGRSLNEAGTSGVKQPLFPGVGSLGLVRHIHADEPVAGRVAELGVKGFDPLLN